MGLRVVHLANIAIADEKMRSPLYEDLRDRLIALNEEKKIDIIVITGDIVEVASRDSFACAEAWLSDIISKLPQLNHNSLLFSPGKKDVCRDSINGMKIAIQENAKIIGFGNIESMLGDKSSHDVLMGGLNEYIDFVQKVSGHAIDKPWWSRCFEYDSVVVGFASFCAHWLAGVSIEKDVSYIGKFQLNSVISDTREADLVFALLCEGSEFLNKDDQCLFIDFCQRSPAIIFTSISNPKITRISCHGSKNYLYLTGSCVDSDGKEPSAFQVVDVGEKQLDVVVNRYFYSGGWVKDRNSRPPDGFSEFFLGSHKDLKNAIAREIISQNFVKTYKDSFSRYFEQLDLGNIGIAYSRETGRLFSASLDEFYQPLKFQGEEHNVCRELRPEFLCKLEAPLLVRGSGGSGKTTWVRYTFRKLLRQKNTFPVLLEVRRLSRLWEDYKVRGKEFFLIEVIEKIILEQITGTWAGAINRVFSSPDGPIPILLIDGWDEIGAFAEDLRVKVHGLQTVYPRLLVVVTSRPYISDLVSPTLEQNEKPSESSFKVEDDQPSELMSTKIEDLLDEPESTDNIFSDSESLNLAQFDVYDIMPLSFDDIRKITFNFFSRCHGGHEERAIVETNTFLKNLKQSSEAYELASNPLFLTMILFISRSNKLPDKRHKLYEICIKNLLTHLPSKYQQDGVLDGPRHWTPDDPEQRLRIISEAALSLQLRHYEGNNASFSIEFSKDAFVDHLSNEIACSKHKLEFINWLIERAGLLIDRLDGVISFSHLSFQEYLAANRLKSSLENHSDRINILSMYSPNVSWWETLRLWIALENSENPERVEKFCSDVGLLEGQHSYWLIGTFHSDITMKTFDDWLKFLPVHLKYKSSNHLKACALAWKNCRHADKRQRLCDTIIDMVTNSSIDFEAAISFNDLAELGYIGLPVPSSIKLDVDSEFSDRYYGFVAMAERQLQRESYSEMDAMDLTHEVYLRMKGANVSSDKHMSLLFYHIARSLLMASHRARFTGKRGAGLGIFSIDRVLELDQDRLKFAYFVDPDMVFILDDLERFDKESYRVVALRMAKFTFGDISVILKLSVSVIKRKLRKAMDWYKENSILFHPFGGLLLRGKGWGS